MKYTSDITVGALKVPESRVIADLLIREVNETGFWEAVEGHNVLQARSRRTARSLALLVRRRLKTMNRDMWFLVRDGSGMVATHAALAAAIKDSPLLGDFLDLVVREQYRLFSPALSGKLWDRFIDDCQGRDPDMRRWSESTIARLRSSVFQSIAQAGYIESTRSMKLQTVHIAPPVLSCLQTHRETYVLGCMQVAP